MHFIQIFTHLIRSNFSLFVFVFVLLLLSFDVQRCRTTTKTTHLCTTFDVCGMHMCRCSKRYMQVYVCRERLCVCVCLFVIVFVCILTSTCPQSH